MIVQPIIRELARDSRLTPTDKILWVICTEHLDMVEFRELKNEVIARDANVSATTAWRGFCALVDSGYLERGVRLPNGGSWTYRIPLRRIYPRSDLKAA